MSTRIVSSEGAGAQAWALKFVSRSGPGRLVSKSWARINKIVLREEEK